MTLGEVFQHIAYQVRGDGTVTSVSGSAQIGGVFLVMVLFLLALFVILAIAIFLFRVTKKKPAENTQSIVSNKREDPEKDLVEGVFGK